MVRPPSVVMNREKLLCSTSRPSSRGHNYKRLGHLLYTDGSSQLLQPVKAFLGAEDTLRSKLDKSEDVHLHKTSKHATEFLWVGTAWTCRKKWKHYGAYSRHGVNISVRDFVYVFTEGNKRLVAYLDDLYEDHSGNKMAVVRWFHKVDEFDLDLASNYYDREIFFSLSLQDLSIECIDGVATVLSPQHYGTFLKMDAHTLLNPFVCRNLFDDEVVKPFDITQVKGYWNQNIHRFMSTDDVGIRPKKRLRRSLDSVESSGLCGPRANELTAKNSLAEGFVGEYKHDYTKGSKIEVLSQDSGIRGMWFRGVVIKKHKDKLKVRYQDIKDADDEAKYLEEWILSSRVADDDVLGIRHSGRMKIRPYRSPSKIDVSLVDVGSIVDAWMPNGWWEGIVVQRESADRIHVYFPGENQRLVLGCKDLRLSEEWLGSEWKQIKSRLDIVDSLSCVGETTKSYDNVSGLCLGHKGNSPEKCELEVVDHHSKEDLLTRLTWSWSTKKKRCYASNNNNLVAVGTRKGVDDESCKFNCRPIAPPLTNLVMSRLNY